MIELSPYLFSLTLQQIGNSFGRSSEVSLWESEGYMGNGSVVVKVAKKIMIVTSDCVSGDGDGTRSKA